ncbi:hypothetical protein [Streptomyces rishiriensis]|uniref:Uncharacterized protein n=1 Tax=Streptomyces rishiriensis TaxID=68264 RepID=A0ABU0NU96_STRRH|nr:hypothetical protein [Streptomyces rishiriensis]MDQ0582679.1 hypothetical protein [Streptomyces rishiriensis]
MALDLDKLTRDLGRESLRHAGIIWENLMRNRLAVLTIAALLPLTGGASLAIAGQASAAPPPPAVTVTGTVDDCEDDSSPEEVSIATSKETKVDDTGVKSSNKYSVKFKNIPKKGRDATATVTCVGGSKYTQEFRVNGAQGTEPVTQKVHLEP